MGVPLKRFWYDIVVSGLWSGQFGGHEGWVKILCRDQKFRVRTVRYGTSTDRPTILWTHQTGC